MNKEIAKAIKVAIYVSLSCAVLWFLVYLPDLKP